MQRNANNNIIKIVSNFDEKTNMLIEQFFFENEINRF